MDDQFLGGGSIFLICILRYDLLLVCGEVLSDRGKGGKWLKFGKGFSLFVIVIMIFMVQDTRGKPCKEGFGKYSNGMGRQGENQRWRKENLY